MWFGELVKLCAFLPYLQNEQSSFAALKDEEAPQARARLALLDQVIAGKSQDTQSPRTQDRMCEERAREDLEKTGR